MRWRTPRFTLGIALLLPLFGDDAAYDAVAEGNALYRAGQYEAAEQQYALAAESMPEAAEIRYNLGNVRYRQFDYEQALEHYTAALDTADPKLAALVKYNMATVSHRRALDNLQTFQDAAREVKAAIRAYRDSLRLDPELADARYNLELAYLLLRAIEEQRVQPQSNAEIRNQKTSDNRGQPFRQEGRNQRSPSREVRADIEQQPQGNEAQQAPQDEVSSDTRMQVKQASAPDEMTPDAAERLLEILRERARAAQSQRKESRRARLRDPAIEKYW